MFPFTLLACFFYDKICGFMIFFFFFYFLDEESNFRNRILTSQKQEFEVQFVPGNACLSTFQNEILHYVYDAGLTSLAKKQHVRVSLRCFCIFTAKLRYQTTITR